MQLLHMIGAVAAAALLPRAAVAGAAPTPNCTAVLPALGCWNDGTGTHPVSYEVLASSTLTLAECVQYCTLSGYPLIGITGHTQPSPLAYCYCGSNISSGAVPAPSSDCNMACPGGGPGVCGGNYRMVVYNSSCNPPLPPPQPPLSGPTCSQPESTQWPFCNTSLPIDARVADLVQRLYLFEMGPQLTARNAPAIPRLGVTPFYWGTNAIHGITNPVSGGSLCVQGVCPTIWPEGPALGASFNASAWRALGATTGIEMRALNNINWNPVGGMDGLTSWATINLIRSPQWGRNQETPSSDPFMLSQFAIEVSRGMQEGEDSRYMMVGTTLKHFAAYSLEDTHNATGFHVTRENFDAIVSPFDLYDTYLPHFQAGVSPVAAGGGAAAGIMLAMNSINGTPCTMDTFLTDLLFESWGMDGYVTSDGGNMITDAIDAYPQGHGWCPYHAPLCTLDEAVEAASNARCAIADGSEYNTNTVSSVLAGNASLAAIQQLLTDTFKIRFRLGLFDNVTAEDSPYWAYGLPQLASPAAQAANALAARQGLVLLQRGALPFARGQGGATAVIGFAVNSTRDLVGNYVNQFCSGGDNAGCFPSILEAIAGLGEQVTYSAGCSNAQTCSAGQIASAAAAAGSADRIVLQLGLDQSLEAEQRDRANVTLPPQQQALFQAVLAAAAGKPLAVVLVHGGAVAIPDVKSSGVAVLDAFYPGTQGGSAIADALFGVYNPGGKLPYDMYDASYEAVDFLDMSFASLGRTYRYYNGPSTPGGAPLWPFGFGLSYSTFALSWTGAPPAPLQVTSTPQTFNFTVTVTNTGTVAGDEVVQVYVVPRAASLQPPPPYTPTRYLVAFQRVAAIPGGGTADVLLSLPSSRFVMTADVAGTRALIAGNYDVAFSRGVNGDELTVAAVVTP